MVGMASTGGRASITLAMDSMTVAFSESCRISLQDRNHTQRQIFSQEPVPIRRVARRKRLSAVQAIFCLHRISFEAHSQLAARVTSQVVPAQRKKPLQ